MNKKLENKSILVIDDEKDLLELLEYSLRDFASSIYVADNGRSGLELIRQHKPSVILSDFHMPNMDGLELLRTLNEEGIDIPVIWMTGYADEQLKRKAWISGVYDLITKPFDMRSLRKSVVAAMSWTPGQGQDCLQYFMSKLALQEVCVAIDKRNYADLIRLCDKKGISITTMVNQLIEAKLQNPA